MTTDPGSLFPVAMHAADIARQIIQTGRPASVTEKSDRDLVSDIDVAVEHAIRDYLKEATPKAGFLGEEEGRSGDAGTAWLWTLDPVDGTSNFTHRLPLCATSLALLHEGRPVLAVIDAPLLDQRYHAVEGRGAFSGTRRLTASTISRLRDAVVAIGDYAVGEEAGRKNELRLAATIQLTPRVHRIRMLGTAALDLAWVADGRLDASITLQNTPWDVCAGALIAREAGVSVTDSDGSPHTLRSAATIAAPAPLLSQIIPLLQAINPAPRAGDTLAGHAPPYAALDAVLSHARYLIFDFDGPVCDLSAAMPATTADQLRAALSGQDTNPSAAPAITATGDPFEILAQAAANSPDLGKQIDSQLTDIEITAVTRATPTAYVHETLAACRDSGRTPAVISRHSARAVEAYLTAHGLADQIHTIIAPTAYPPGHLQPGPYLMEEAISAFGTASDRCAVITATAQGMQAARTARIPTIGFTATIAASEHLAATGAGCTIASLADLTLRLRARPLPS